MTVRELLTRTDSRELSEWIAYEQITGPLGPERADIHAGIIASTIANANRGKGSRKATPADFIPKWDKPKQTAVQQLSKVKQLNAAFGGSRSKRRRQNGNE